MQYDNIHFGRFISRPNRFIAEAEVNGKTETVHVKNTGRCRELLVPGSEIALTFQKNGGRKTAFDLVAVKKANVGWVNIDSQAPNKAVLEWLKRDPDIFRGITEIKPEYSYGKSRIDFYLECGKRKILLEVKGCTLEKNGIGYFPDAPTERGSKHLRELSEAVKNGFESYLAFVIAVNGVTEVRPNGETDPGFENALREAEKGGVCILNLASEVTAGSLNII